MEISTSKSEVSMTVLLKAGIPLALSIAAFISAKIMARRSISRDSMSETTVNSSQTNSHEGLKHEESFHSSAYSCVVDERTNTMDGKLQVGDSDSVVHDKPGSSEENLSLRSRIEGLEMTELKLQNKFNRYCDLKEKESALTELRNMMVLEAAHMEYLNREVSSIEAENKRFQALVVQYMNIIDELEELKSKNGFLQRKVKKLVKKTKAQSYLIKEQNLKIISREEEILRNHEATETMNVVINNLESKIRVLHTGLDKLHEENSDLLQKLHFLENSNPPADESKTISEEDYRQVLNEMGELQKERTDEVKELVYLRWMNACLKHELMRNHEQKHQEKGHVGLDFEGGEGIIHYDTEHELEDHRHHTLLENNVPSNGGVHGDHSHSKRRKLLRKLRKWVEGGERSRGKVDGKEMHKCSGSQTASDATVDNQDHTRRSFSSS